MIFEKNAGDSYIAINIECKFFWPDSKMTFNSKEIRNKYEKMRTKYLRLLAIIFYLLPAYLAFNFVQKAIL